MSDIELIEKIRKQPCKECGLEDGCWVREGVGGVRRRFFECRGWVFDGCIDIRDEAEEVL